MQRVPTKVPTVTEQALKATRLKLLRRLEARAGIEPAHKGFADLSLTTWVPRLGRAAFEMSFFAPNRRSQPGCHRRAVWSGRRDLNSRPSPWQGDALPLSYSRLMQLRVYRAAEIGSNRARDCICCLHAAAHTGVDGAQSGRSSPEREPLSSRTI